jgi:hypothetical protein
MLKIEVQEAIDELKVVYGEGSVEVTEDGEGGAYVIVSNADLGEKYAPAVSWCGFRITFMYPDAQVYPHFFTPDLKRTDGKALGTGFGVNVTWNNRNTVQVSRKSGNWNSAVDTAQIKLEKVLQWLKEQ